MSHQAFDPANDDLIIASRKEIVFIEDNVADIDTLIKGIGSGKEVVILDATRDGLHQIAQALAGRSGVDALHIMSHGSEGALNLGSLMLDAGQLGAHQDDLQTIGRSMSADGDILLYGCDVGAGSGAGFVQQLALATGADVAASGDATGAAALGGDWDLEVSSGKIEAAPVVDAATAALYQHVLNLPTGKIDFNTAANFVSGFFLHSDDPGDALNVASTDVVYKLGGQSAYQFKIDGEWTAVGAYDNPAGQIFVAPRANEQMATMSFVGGQLFMAQSIAISNWTYADETIVIKGYDAANNPVGSTGPITLPGDYFDTTGPIPVDLSGIAVPVASLKIVSSQAGGWFTYLKIDSITITNIIAPPHVSSVTASPSTGTHAAGDTITVSVTFDSVVDVTGTPQLTLATGGTGHAIDYKDGSGTATLNFTYTIGAGENASDLDYLSTGALSLHGGTIKSHSSGMNADLTLPMPGGAGSLSLNAALVIDTTAPNAPSAPDLDANFDKGSSNTDNVTKLTQLKFNGTVSNADAVTVKLYDGATEIGSGAVSSNSYAITTTGSLSPGDHTITAKAIDAVGNVSSASSGVTVTVDTAAPTVALTSSQPSLKAGETATITFTFSEDPGTSFTADSVSVSGGILGSISGTSGLTRTATFTPTPNVNAGSGSVAVNAGSYQDQAGNDGAAASLAAIGYDTLRPTLTISSSAPSMKAGETATITFSFSEDPGSSFSWDGEHGDIAVSGGILSALMGGGTAGGVTTYTATFTPTADVNNGTASISVQGSDYQDSKTNTGSNASLSFGFDTLAPSKPSGPILDVADDSGAAPDDYLTNANPLHLRGSAEAGSTVWLYDGGDPIAHVTASAGGAYTFTLTDLAEANHSFATVAIDAAGNSSAASDGLAVIVDRTAPTATAVSIALSNDTGASATDMVTSEASQTISGTLDAALADGDRVMVSLDNGASWTPASAGTGSTSWGLAGVTLPGSGTLKVQVVDQAGNAGTTYARSYVLDTVAPAKPAAPDLDAGSDSGTSDTDNITGVTQPSFSGSGVAVGSTVRLYDGATEIGATTVTGATWQITVDTPLDPGSHSITAKATDLAGNVSDASDALSIQVLSGGPATKVDSVALSLDSGVAGDFITNQASQTISGVLSAALAAGERVQVSLDGGHAWSDATSSAGSSAWSIAATLSPGSHDIRVRVIDAVDNSGPVKVQAYTLDSVQPTVSISSSAAQLKAGETSTITFTFSEDPGTSFSWDGTHGSVTVSGGTLSAIQGSGTTYTATFTPAANVNAGTAGISIAAGSYHDLADNAGLAGVTPSHGFDTLPPAAPSAPDLDKDSDKGASDTDKVTSSTALVFKGTAEAGATIRLYDSDGTTEIGHGTATGGSWTITTSTLNEGSHTVTAKAFDAAGNASAASNPLSVTVDTTKPAAMAAPALASASDSGAIGDGITKVTKPTFSGSAEAFAQVTVYDGKAVLGTATADALGAWNYTASADLVDGEHAISARQTDKAGNVSDAGAVFSLTIDTVAPAAPGTPQLQASSDTGTVGDNATQNTAPVFEGTAAPGTHVTLFDISGGTKVKLGSTMSDGSGKWSAQSLALDAGTHTIVVNQNDAAGNLSSDSAALTLRIEAAPVPPPVTLVDGVRVDYQPVFLPGGVLGSAVSIPVVNAGRQESSGSPGVADIPLATSSQGATLLLAQVAPGYGLNASGASMPVANGAQLLLDAIRAATPAHTATDQGHLTGNAQSFLDGLASNGALLVESVKPAGSPASSGGMLTLSGPATAAGQGTALVIDASGLAQGSTIGLQNVNFAAVIGAANVVAGSATVLSGDAAGQHFTVAAGSAAKVFAGGGNDVLTVSLVSNPAAGVALLHGGSASDTATFSGARSDYNVEYHNGYVLVASKDAPQAKTMLVNVEQLQFSDAGVTVQNSADIGTLAGLYQSVLGRQADVGGMEFFANVHQAGTSWGAIALGMIGSNEHAAGHEGFNGIAAHDVGLLYASIFGRAGDADGMAFWTNALAHGVTLEQVASAFLQSAEMTGHQRPAIDWDFIV